MVVTDDTINDGRSEHTDDEDYSINMDWIESIQKARIKVMAMGSQALGPTDIVYSILVLTETIARASLMLEPIFLCLSNIDETRLRDIKTAIALLEDELTDNRLILKKIGGVLQGQLHDIAKAIRMQV